MTLLQMKLEAIEHARFRALAQLIIDKDKGHKAFEEYMKIAFPYLEATKKQEVDKHVAILNQELKRGPMRVTAVTTPALKSRMAQAKAARQKPQSPSEERKLYQRIGRSL